MDFDVIVIGSGPGGYVTAIRASQLGLKTAIVEREALGGVCLNWGCIPTKALLKSGEAYENLSHLADYGLKIEKASFDFSKIVERSRKVAGQLNSGVTYLMKKHKIEVIEGVAKLDKGQGAPKVVVALKAGGSRTVQAKHVILATGARARTVPAVGMEPDGERIWTYREAMVPKAAPKSLIVIGSGAIGIEFASFYRALGSDVTVIEALPRILPVEDEEVSKAAHKAFEKRGLNFRVGASVKKLTKSKSGVSIELESGGKTETLEADIAIVAIGIVGNVEDLGLEALGVKIEKTHIVTDAHGETGVPGLYAIGDVAGPPWLAHKASHEGVHCVEHIAGLKPNNLSSPIPGCTYSSPQIASVGLTEAQAKEQGIEAKVGRFPFKVNGKAIASGDTDGFVKTVFDGKTGALIGAHMIGAEVTEMIQGFTLAITLEATEEEVFATVFPHPTLSEAMHEAALDAYGRVLHI
ncbi:dihydrolipoamide dehydrogenase [Phenylobacterium sp. Root77]|jgi:dihydrolipoamide dehydrogenase|uniref:dihydrolipoyl dehydrogenase n=1 Tax=unclassified Phenylobacterium TaxID=2640670 RepID=UPI0006FB427F|nr:MULTISPECIES: dihydrolipoyl dehydrogenase [unclassified Phenylobacterium]KQW71579.1 dihydrolipoamide dehydrogenase [Phenylobacterium sp. Root1277]KQW94499.1 dihydrolipoamide dehydrogenase [Phenylobacterium sp. Root1290]KRC44193.1 dihydrolipoamide dehydrogenase [Phenylobacterium sp. Root77]